jgi:hypothetical protein
MVSGCGSGFSLHLLVLTVSGCEVGFELCPSFFSGWFFVSPATCAHDVACCKYFCVPNVDLLRVTNEDAPCVRIVSTILNMLEESLHWLLGIPSSAHVFKVDLEVDCSDVAVGLKEVVQHASCLDVGISHHVVIQYVQVPWLEHADDLLLQCLLDGGACPVSLNILFPNVASGADLGRCSIRCCW